MEKPNEELKYLLFPMIHDCGFSEKRLVQDNCALFTFQFLFIATKSIMVGCNCDSEECQVICGVINDFTVVIVDSRLLSKADLWQPSRE